MSLKKVKTQNLELVKENQPELLSWIESNFRGDKLSKEVKGKIAGLLIEVVIQSGGNNDVFILGEECDKPDPYQEEFEVEDFL